MMVTEVKGCRESSSHTELTDEMLQADLPHIRLLSARVQGYREPHLKEQQAQIGNGKNPDFRRCISAAAAPALRQSWLNLWASGRVAFEIWRSRSGVREVSCRDIHTCLLSMQASCLQPH